MVPSSSRTEVVRAGVATDTAFGAVIPPLYLSSNFEFAGLGLPRKHDYTRSGNPTRDQLEVALSRLESAAGGVVTASGMAAVTAVLHASGRSRVLAPLDCYGGTYRLLSAYHERGFLNCSFVDFGTDDWAAGLGAAGEALVWIETPSNPLLRITDLAAVIARAHAAAAIVVVDNTFLSPIWQRPLELGADVVVHSTTKYLNGHSDVVGGAALARDPELVDRLRYWSNCLGLTGSPFDAYLTLRGLRTLHARLQQHERNARAIAALLVQHPGVRCVHYPGLAEHDGHEIARRQQDGYGAIVSFELRDPDQVGTVVDSLRYFSLAESLGGVESLVAHPATMTHAAMPAAARARAGISDGLLRLSLGIESIDDLTTDLQTALDRALQAVDVAEEVR
ncbi:MAG: cystathionine gamma-synthase [Planctomycetota bacterium]